MYSEYEIRPVPLSVKVCHQQVEDFLKSNALRMEEALDYYAAVFRKGDEEILAGGGLQGDTIKCIAVSDHVREEGFSNRLVSHLISEANAQGHQSVKVFTKPANREIFESMGFRLIAQAPKAILMENGQGLKDYCRYLSNLRRLGNNGVIVMNANPFTLGHQYLIKEAAKQVDRLYVIVVKEERSVFKYAERKAMIEQGTEDLMNVTVCEGSNYAVSGVTFPTYFLKEITDATDTQILLDLDLFVHFIAPHLGVTIRFVGSEPTDELTARYNLLMEQVLPQHGYKTVEIPRYQSISASVVRKELDSGHFCQATSLTPPSSHPYLLAYLATQALQQELDTTPKPGLVDRQDNGAHHDMDYPMMKRSIQILRPFFVQLAEIREWNDNMTQQEQSAFLSSVQHIGIAAEEAMLNATGGINTHRGAIFALGLAVTAAASVMKTEGEICMSSFRKTVMAMAKLFPKATDTHGATVIKEYPVKGALACAQEA
ncbi:MAG: [Prevotella sp.]|nr:[citrate (pro-3S)-lyase] ligase [Prevotella sp.]